MLVMLVRHGLVRHMLVRQIDSAERDCYSGRGKGPQLKRLCDSLPQQLSGRGVHLVQATGPVELTVNLPFGHASY